jgi:hypothetical protein
MYTIESTMKGSTKAHKRVYESRSSAMAAWDSSVENAMGGDVLRLIGPDGTLAVYSPVDRDERLKTKEQHNED